MSGAMTRSRPIMMAGVSSIIAMSGSTSSPRSMTEKRPPERAELLDPGTSLQADEPDALDPGQFLELGERERPIAIAAMIGVPLPGDADLEARPGGQPIAPSADPHRISPEVRDRRGDRVHGPGEQAHHPREGRVDVEFRHRVTLRDDPIDSRTGLREPDQGLLARHDHPRATTPGASVHIG